MYKRQEIAFAVDGKKAGLSLSRFWIHIVPLTSYFQKAFHKLSALIEIVSLFVERFPAHGSGSFFGRIQIIAVSYTHLPTGYCLAVPGRNSAEIVAFSFIGEPAGFCLLYTSSRPYCDRGDSGGKEWRYQRQCSYRGSGIFKSAQKYEPGIYSGGEADDSGSCTF